MTFLVIYTDRMSETNFLLDIKLISNCKKIRKDVKCWNFEMVVDSDKSNYMDFLCIRHH